MNFNKILLIFSLLIGILAPSQGKDTIITKPLSQYPPDELKTDQFGNKYYYDPSQKAKIYEIDGETVVVMDEIVLRAKPHFNNQLDQNYYFFINKKLYRVYPLFLTALEQYRSIQRDVASMQGSDKKNFIRQKQNALADQYEAKLRDLTTTEGKVFAKLMNRATGKTVYEIIKELRGGWSAFWWNVKGNMADVDIKAQYSPRTDRTDEFLESLLQSNWNVGYLQPYPGYQEFQVP